VSPSDSLRYTATGPLVDAPAATFPPSSVAWYEARGVPLELDLLAPEFLADPYPVYHRLRAEDPVHWEPKQKFWALSRYDDALAVLRDPRVFSSAIHGAYQGADAGVATGEWFVFRDPPDHTRLRGLVNAAFTPRVVESLRPRIQRIVDDLVDDCAARGEFDVIAALGFPLPAIVIAELLGVPPEDRARFRAWSADLAAVGGIVRTAPDRAERIQRARDSVAALNAYFREFVRRRRDAPRDDLVSRLAAATLEGDALTEPELVATCVLLLFAGHETTTNLIGNGTLALLRHPDALARLRTDPTLVASAVEELLRYESPVQVRVRIARQDVAIGGQRIRGGERVVVLVGAANRDPNRFPDPDRLDVGRPDNRHLAFGHGIHFCTGAPLARLEGAIAIETLLRRFPDLHLATEEVAWRETASLRGLKALAVAHRGALHACT